MMGFNVSMMHMAMVIATTFVDKVSEFVENQMGYLVTDVVFESTTKGAFIPVVNFYMENLFSMNGNNKGIISISFSDNGFDIVHYTDVNERSIKEGNREMIIRKYSEEYIIRNISRIFTETMKYVMNTDD